MLTYGSRGALHLIAQRHIFKLEHIKRIFDVIV